jgi:hypothetical protein
MDEIQRRKPWLTHKRPEPWGALVMSDNTRNFYGRSAGLVEERYMASVFGAFRAVVEEHLPVTVINDWNVTGEDLAEYKVLILPNTACLDERQTAAIREYVRNGGGLVASLDVSLFNEFGDPRDNFELADVLGVDYRGLPETSAGETEALDVNFAQSIGSDYWEQRKNVFEFQQDVDAASRTLGASGSLSARQRMATYVGANPVTFKGPAVRVAVSNSTAQTLGTIRVKSVPNAPQMSGVVAHTFGKGRVVYLAAGLTRRTTCTPTPTSGWCSDRRSNGPPPRRRP